jgi:hypothetical protein
LEIALCGQGFDLLPIPISEKWTVLTGCASVFRPFFRIGIVVIADSLNSPIGPNRIAKPVLSTRQAVDQTRFCSVTNQHLLPHCYRRAANDSTTGRRAFLILSPFAAQVRAGRRVDRPAVNQEGRQ